eukprot:scaffold1729_cov117-Cylindrotheca_fusiformis.AAC.5
MAPRLYPADTMGEPLLLDNITTTSAAAPTSTSRQQEDISSERTAARYHGMVIGFLTQVINISGTALMCYIWGVDTSVVSEHESNLDHFLHWVVWMLSQVDLQLYLLMWIGLTAALTGSGVKWIQRRTGDYSSRSIFVIGVTFYAGVVIGSFASWALLDAALGLPAPMLPMVGVLIFGLLVSYSMIWCFDMEHDDEDDEATYSLAEP